MTDHELFDESALPFPPAAPEMARKLAINRTGRLTAAQRRVALIAGLVTLGFLLCPAAMLVQLVATLLSGDFSAPTLASLFFAALGVIFMIVFFGLFGVNAAAFLPEAFGKHPVRYARGPLVVRVTKGSRPRPELPFSYIVGDYSFAPYIPPHNLALVPGGSYLVYYAARSRLLLSIAALDAPDAAQWEPEFKQPA